MLRDHNCLIEGFSFTDLNFVFLDSVSFNFEENRYPLGAVVDRMNKYRRESENRRNAGSEMPLAPSRDWY